MAASIQREHPQAQIELIPGGGGDFIVMHEQARIWDKRATGLGFPRHEDILKKISA